jgi:hypothetical protein
MNNIIKVIKNPYKIFVYLAYKGLFKWLKDETYLKFMFRGTIGYQLNLKKPVTFNEKLQWLKVHDRKPEYTIMVDKYKVRQYVTEVIGENYLIPLLGVWDKFEDIDFNKLPDKFVLKPNHTSGNIYICKDKSKIDMEILRKEIAKWLKREYYWYQREWPYKNIKPRIVCEKYMVDESCIELKDYKVLCFNGKAKLIEVHRGRFFDHRQDFYDISWNKTSISQGDAFSDISDDVMDKPKCFDEMIELSEKLAGELIHVRIDWYIVNNKLYFGEITFFDGSGFDAFNDFNDDLMLGSWIKLP